MEILAAIANAAIAPFASLASDWGDRVNWIYLAAALAIAVGVQWRREAAAGFRSALSASLPRAIYAHPSARVDYCLWIVNAILIALALPALVVSSQGMQALTSAALASLAGGANAGLAAGPFARGLYTATDILALDFGLFFAHWLQHRVPVLWEFHKTHHSAEVLTPITVFRMHPVDIWLNTSLTATLLGLNAGVFGFLYAEPPALFSVFGFNIVMFAFLVAGYHLRHSHVWVMYPHWIARHISSPAMHLIHHGTDPKYFNTNFAQIFTLWDRIAGTLYFPEEQERVEFGLGKESDFPARSVLGLYLAPFHGIAERWRKLAADEPSKAASPQR